MKKTCFLLLVFICFKSYGQDSVIPDTIHQRTSTTLYGYKIGLSYSQLHGSQVDFRLSRNGQLERRLGFELGFNLKHWINNNFYGRFEINYLQKGGSISGGGFYYSNQARFDYINFPLLIGVSPYSSDIDGLNISLEGGGSFNVLARSNQNLRDGLHPDNVVEENHIIPTLNLGFNIERKINARSYLFFNYRYHRDLNYFFKRTYHYTQYDSPSNTYTPQSEVYDMWHKGSSITVGILFVSKK